MQFQPRLPLGSRILVTGVNGLVASNVAAQALSFGYKVRGTVRNIEKAQWMQDRFDKEYPGSFELVAVPDLAADGAFDDAVKGVSGIAHIASIIGYVDPNKMIPGVVDGSLNVLKAARKEPTVQAVVLTSSSWAAATPIPDKVYHIDSSLWNEDAVKQAWAPPPYEQDRLMAVYAASKVEGEKACWDFMQEKKPSFTFNAVLPAANFGHILDHTNQGFPSTMEWLKDLFLGNINIQPFIPPRKSYHPRLQIRAD
jgi:nucleoside-diphosphate-sugar epimerase